MHKEALSKSPNVFNILLVEDNPDDIFAFRGMIEQILSLEGQDTELNIELHEACEAKMALDLLREQRCDVLFLDLSLPGTRGKETVALFKQYAIDVPTIILTGMDDIDLAKSAMRAGFQDYLVKGEFNHHSLWKSILHAIERHCLLKSVRELADFDELTKLLNRRGFYNNLEKYLNLTRRQAGKFSLAYIDLDHFKYINDQFGHAEGDNVLVVFSELLLEIFRDSDLVARLGGDEFAVLLMNTDKQNVHIVQNRLKQHLETLNQKRGAQYHISISIGIAHHNNGESLSALELLEKADAEMYKDKAAKRQSESVSQ